MEPVKTREKETEMYLTREDLVRMGLPKKGEWQYTVADITLICDEAKIDEKGCYGAPDLVIEIVSHSNRKMDYVRKPALYHEAGVREYWIVDPKHQQVAVYCWEQSEQPVLHPFSERIKVGVYDDLLDIANLHGTLEEVLAEERQASRAEGRAEGLAEGETRFAELTERLLSAGRILLYKCDKYSAGRSIFVQQYVVYLEQCK